MYELRTCVYFYAMRLLTNVLRVSVYCSVTNSAAYSDGATDILCVSALNVASRRALLFT